VKVVLQFLVALRSGATHATKSALYLLHEARPSELSLILNVCILKSVSMVLV
jgi:hypothetical protein